MFFDFYCGIQDEFFFFFFFFHLGLGDNIGNLENFKLTIIWKFICTMVSYRRIQFFLFFDFIRSNSIMILC
jgi:hypothetical protein